MTERETDDPTDGPTNRTTDRTTERIDPLADGVDVERVESELRGWGGASTPPGELTPEQLEHLQDTPEPIGGGETGRALHGDQGHADPVWQADAPETREPDTSLGHRGHRGQGAAEAPPEH